MAKRIFLAPEGAEVDDRHRQIGNRPGAVDTAKPGGIPAQPSRKAQRAVAAGGEHDHIKLLRGNRLHLGLENPDVEIGRHQHDGIGLGQHRAVIGQGGLAHRFHHHHGPHRMAHHDDPVGFRPRKQPEQVLQAVPCDQRRLAIRPVGRYPRG
jgi:hypothetical protein